MREEEQEKEEVVTFGLGYGSFTQAPVSVYPNGYEEAKL